ncbi:MAG: sterol desaturase family protein [Saprospiraceae bacterium]
MVDINQLVIWSTPLYTVLIIFEIVLGHFHHQNTLYTVKDTMTNIYLTALNMICDVLLRGVAFGVLLIFAPFAFFELEHSFWYWLLLFLFEDFAFYWLHRVDHSVRLFWAVHVTHHSSEHFNLSTGFRSSVFQPVYRFFYFIPLVFLGFQPIDIYLMYAITQIYGIIVHTQAVNKLGILEHFLVTPSHHRVHHASNPIYLDKNLGMILIVWDKLFGTFQKELAEEPVRYGLYEKEIKRDPVNIVFHEWKDIFRDWNKSESWKEKLKYLFNPPGWSHDGSTQTAKQMRAKQKT